MQDEFASFRDHVTTALSSLEVQLRSMFGGFGLVRNGSLFGLLYKDHLYLRTRPETRAEYEARGCREYRAFGAPAKKLQGYMRVPDDVLGDARTLERWAREAATDPATESAPERHELPRPIRRRR